MAKAVYHAAYHAATERKSSFAPVVTFGAATDDAAAAIAALIDAAVSAKRTSLTKRILAHNVGATHPTGTVFSATGILRDAGGAIFRFRMRNVSAEAINEDLVSVFTGAVASDDSDLTFTALAGAVYLPNSMNGVASVASVNIVNKT